MFRLIVIAVICTGLVIPIAGFASRIVSNYPLLIVISIGLAYLAFPILLLRVWPAPTRRDRSQSMADALLEGDLVTYEHQVLGAAQIEELEDEGMHFLLAIEAGHTLCLSGQYLYGLVERGVFPSERLRLFKHKITGQFYGIEAVGPPLTDWVVYDPITVENSRRDSMPHDGETYAETIDQMASSLGLQVAAKQGVRINPG